MATYALRLRRALTSLSAVNRPLSFASHGVSAAPAPIPISSLSRSSPILGPPLLQCRSFRSSTASLSARGNFEDFDKIDPDTILFEGCDYNHWLITMDFPKDPKPTPEEMVRTYEETCAKGLKISLEEAKQRMYACSTTTYQGFQAVMTEAESEQFREIPGVVFILPDSYIDPQNKEYGGDKYENGVITPRPPPIQYGRQRTRDRNRDMPRYDRDGRQMRPPQQQYNNTQGDMQRGDGRNYGPPQNYPPQQNYGPPGQGDGRNPLPNNTGYNPDGRGPPPPQQSWGQQNNFYNQERRDAYPGNQRNYAPPQNEFRGNNMNSAPNTPGGSYGPVGYQGPGMGGSYVSYGQGPVHNNGQGQGQGPNYGQGQVQGGPGNQGRGMGGGYGQGQGPYYGHDNVGQGQGQGQGQGEGPRNVQGDPGGFDPRSPNQGRY